MKGARQKTFAQPVRQRDVPIASGHSERWQFAKARASVRGVDHFPEATRKILASLSRSGVAGVLVPSPRAPKLARELRKEIGNLCDVTVERGAVRVQFRAEAREFSVNLGGK